MKINSLNGNEIIVGDNINIPSASKMFATTKSSTINGTKTTKPISKATLSSLKIYAGAISQIVNSSGDLGGALRFSSTKNAKSDSLVCYNINSFKGFEPSSIATSMFPLF